MVPKPARYTAVLVSLIALAILLVEGLFTVVSWIYQLDLANQLWLQLLGAVALALLIGWVALGTSPVIRDALATFRRLTRLESLSHPLLLRLSREAPGTFHHSLQVGALAHQAATAIGADAFLARLGGYYHDIGKLANPANFIENQGRQGNPLNERSPRQAAKLIIAHVDDGLVLARTYGLPAELSAMIAQHTGTTTVRYFLEQARASGKRVHADDFRYPGPKPLTREAAIVMLADSIEAKARLLAHPSHRSLQSLVLETVREKMTEQQLELAGLTKTELDQLAVAFTEALETMYHRRIAYPTQKL